MNDHSSYCKEAYLFCKMNPECLVSRVEIAVQIHERSLQQLKDLVEQFKKLEDLRNKCMQMIATCENPKRKEELEGHLLDMNQTLKDVETSVQQSVKITQDAAEIKVFLESLLNTVQN
jgi:hypothetical protein